MIYAIAKARAELGDHSQMEIISCPIRKHEGQIWLTTNPVSFGCLYLVKFDPQDQFCKVVNLDKIKEVNNA